MEKWQEEIISRRLPKLLANTICNNQLLVHLLASRILNLDEVKYLTSLPNNQTQVFNLYGIVMTRVGGFEKMLEGLQETTQTGAVCILRTECVKRETEELGDIFPVTYDRNQILGKGSQGTVVYRGKFGTRDVAVKRIPITILDEKESQALLNEVRILEACDQYENIVRYFGCKQAEDSVLIVLELCDMTLNEWIANKTIEISPLEILKQVTVGLEWLHSIKIVHRDLKPANIVMNRNMLKVKLSDFGMSRLVGNDKSYASSIGIGTLGWVAPEILSQLLSDDSTQMKFTFASDVFSLGCVYYYVLSDGKPPFGDRLRCSANILAGTLAIDRKDLKYCLPQNINELEKMIASDPYIRPTCSELILCNTFGSTMLRTAVHPYHLKSQILRGNQLVCRFTTYDVMMGRQNSEGNVELLPNWLGQRSTMTLIGQTRENRIVYGMEAAENKSWFFSKKTDVVRQWSLWGLVKDWPNKVEDQFITYEGTKTKMTVDFFLGQLLKFLKLYAESQTGQTFSRVVITVPLCLDIGSFLRYGALRWASFKNVQVKSETECIARSFLSSNILEGDLLILSQNSMNVDVVVFACKKGAQIKRVFDTIAFIPNSEASIFGMASLLFVITRFAEYLSKNVMLKPTTKECLVKVFKARSPTTALISYNTNEAYNQMVLLTKKFSTQVTTNQIPELKVIEGAILLSNSKTTPEFAMEQ